MKQKTLKTTALSLLLCLLLLLTACGGDSLWDTATYREDTELGEGALTVTVTVTAEERSVVFTLHTDKENLADALLEHELCQGEVTQQYGLMISHVNGIRADYNLDAGYYWSLLVEGEYAMEGASSTPIVEGGSYELARIR